MRNYGVSHKLSRNIYKVSVMKNLPYKQVERSIDKNTNKIPITYR